MLALNRLLSTACTLTCWARSAAACARASACSLSCLLTAFRSAKSFIDAMRRLLLAFQVALGVQCCHATGTGAGDGLAVDMVLHVAGGKYARHAGGGGHAFQAGLGFDVAVVHVQLAFEDARVRLVADGDKYAVHIQGFNAAVD